MSRVNGIEIVEVSGRKFTLQKLDAVQALKLKLRLGKTLAPALQELAAAYVSGGFSKDPSADDFDVSSVAAAFVEIMDKLNVEDATNLIVDLCQLAHIHIPDGDNRQVTFALDFADDLTPAYLLAAEVVKFNFGKYLGNINALAQGQ